MSTKNNQGGITVRCHTSTQARKLKTISHLGQWSVETEYAKSKTQSKGVITGLPIDISDQEIISACKKSGITEVTRLMRKRDGHIEKSLSVCLTFNTPNLPPRIQLGYEIFEVKPYIPPVIRCFNCQRLGHVASRCRAQTRCVRCSGNHNYEACTQKEQVRCCRCGGSHSSAYARWSTITDEKKIQGIRVTYNI